METQKVIVKIPRKQKQEQLIPFNLEFWNTGEYEALEKDLGLVRIICTDNGGSYPIVIGDGTGGASTYTIEGKYNDNDLEPSLFLQKKLDEELPMNKYISIYLNSLVAYDTEEEAELFRISNRLALVHMTYEFED